MLQPILSTGDLLPHEAYLRSQPSSRLEPDLKAVAGDDAELGRRDGLDEQIQAIVSWLDVAVALR